MSYKQGPFELNFPLTFGKYKGIQVSEIYSGNPSKILSGYHELLKSSFEHIFSKWFLVTINDVVDLSMIEEKGLEKISIQKIYDFGTAINKGATCNFQLELGKVKFNVYKQSIFNKELSMTACLLAQIYMERILQCVEIEQLGRLRPGIVWTDKLDKIEEVLNLVEGNPNYIHWCIDKVEGFFLKGSEEQISDLHELPIFSFDSFEIGKIQADSSFTFNSLLHCRFAKASKRTVTENFKKQQKYIKAKNIPYYPKEVFNDDVIDYLDNDDDEDNIMRGLENGNGDSFGF